jgi:Na+-driven multidrug efflux pump
MFSMYYSGQLAKPEVPMAVNWLLLPAQLGLSWWLTSAHGVVGAGIAAVAGAALLCGVFGGLFLGRGETPQAGRLLRLQREDVESWKRLLRR